MPSKPAKPSKDRPRGKAKHKPPAPPKPAKQPMALFLVTEGNNKLGGMVIAPGRLDSRRHDWSGAGSELFGAYGPNGIVYYVLSTSNARYLHEERVWPIHLLPETELVFDEMWAKWTFNVVEVGPPLELANPATWEHFIDGGLRMKPKKKAHPSALKWPAIKGHADVLRLLLDAGVEAGADDPLTGAAAFLQPSTTELLIERGFDVAKSIEIMTRYKNDDAVALLEKLSRR